MAVLFLKNYFHLALKDACITIPQEFEILISKKIPAIPTKIIDDTLNCQANDSSHCQT